MTYPATVADWQSVAAQSRYSIFGVPATYTPPPSQNGAGPAVSVRVITGVPDTRGDFGQIGLKLAPAGQAEALVVRLRAADLAVLVRGASVAVNGRTYPVKDVEPEPNGLEWRLHLGVPA